jgi:hypothetical protein
MAANRKRLDLVVGKNPLAARIVQRRDAAHPEVPLERLEAELGDASRYDIVACLKQLEKAGVGEFVVGRKGRKSRFVWAEPADGEPVVARPAESAVRAPSRMQGAANRAAARPRAQSELATSGASRSLRHSFYVRPGVLATLELPEDISGAEIERLCQLLRALPFAAGKTD